MTTSTKKKNDPPEQQVVDTKTDTPTKSAEIAEAKAPAKKSASRSDKRRRVRKDLDRNMYVTVRNGFHGPLVYIDKNTSEQYTWAEFGDEADLTLSVLLNARNSQRRFFEENWWLIDDPDVIEYLGVEKYYKNALTYADFDELFSLDIGEIREKIKALSEGQRRGVAFMAREQIESGELSDLNIVKMLEDVLNTELISGR